MQRHSDFLYVQEAVGATEVEAEEGVWVTVEAEAAEVRGEVLLQEAALGLPEVTVVDTEEDVEEESFQTMNTG